MAQPTGEGGGPPSAGEPAPEVVPDTDGRLERVVTARPDGRRLTRYATAEGR